MSELNATLSTASSKSSEVERLTRDNLDAHTVRVLHSARNWTKADVKLVRMNSHLFAVKDIRQRSWLARLLFGRWLLRREFDVLWRLRGMEGVPQVYKMLDEDAFVMDYIEGTNIRKMRRVSEATLRRLSDLFDELHRRGVAHGDPHKSNVLVTAAGEPFLIDFSTAYTLQAPSSKWREHLWRALQTQDLRSVAKLKRRFTPDLLTVEERQLLESPTRLYRVGQTLRAGWERLTFKGWRKRWKTWRRRMSRQ
ncbi:MAG: AarF/UbiB family protein [Abditibacteriales bacterium]|nr:AarF/UbiB family protein [Abditibacteriales bacterium]MDW8364268.1 lipopolysaccharide core heptose(II) kinase RfaY [Abditibacteriales bacterium]